MGLQRMQTQVQMESTNVIASQSQLSLKGHTNHEKLLTTGREQTSLLPSRRARGRIYETPSGNQQ